MLRDGRGRTRPQLSRGKGGSAKLNSSKYSNYARAVLGEAGPSSRNELAYNPMISCPILIYRFTDGIAASG
jgi:hypothetical protein